MIEKWSVRRSELQMEGARSSRVITSSEDLIKAQTKLERPLVNYLNRALPTTPHYFSRIEFGNLEFEDFNKIPLTTPEDLFRDPKSFIFDRENVVQVTSSGGTYGARKIIYRTNGDLDRSVEATVGMFKVTGVKHGDVVAILQPFDLWNIGHIALNTLRKMGVLSVPVGLSSSDEEILELLRAEGVNVVYGTPSKLTFLAELSKESKIDLQIVKALSAGEPLLPKHRAIIMRDWSAEAFGVYGSEETDGIGVECQEHKGYHMIDENLIIEILDPESLTYANKPEGLMAITKINNEGTVLVRYLLGDIVEIDKEPCSCGLETVRIQPKGRLQETAWLYDGRKITTKALDQLFHDFLGTLPQYQVVVFKERGFDRLRISIDMDIGSGARRELLELIPKASQDLVEGVSKKEIELEFITVKAQQFYKTSRGKIPRVVYREMNKDNE
jgi:phenylacetate-CoA ligase